MNTVSHGSKWANTPLVPIKPRQTDPLVLATRKAYRESMVGQLEVLLKEQSRWKSKQTMAVNKLAAVRAKIADMALMLAVHADKLGLKGKVLP